MFIEGKKMLIGTKCSSCAYTNESETAYCTRLECPLMQPVSTTENTEE